MLKIQDFYLGHLRLEEDFGFHILVLAELKRYSNELMKLPAEKYTNALTSLDTELKTTGGENPYSKKVQKADAACSQTYSSMTKQVKVMLKHYDDATAEIARQVNIIIRKYARPNQRPYLEKMGVLTNLLQDLEAFDMPPTDRPEELGVEPPKPLTQILIRGWVDLLTESKDAFISIYKIRNAEQASHVTGATKNARKMADDAYHEAIARINSIANVNGVDEILASIIYNINALIDRQRINLATRKTKNANKEKDKPEEEPSDKPDIV